MSDLGRITRVSGEEFGSCMTFGAGRDASAPGQIEAMNLKDALDKNSLRLKNNKSIY
jgi:3-dehydroquinate dehydratase-1